MDHNDKSWIKKLIDNMYCLMCGAPIRYAEIVENQIQPEECEDEIYLESDEFCREALVRVGCTMCPPYVIRVKPKLMS
jgi:hypothetical protein